MSHSPGRSVERNRAPANDTDSLWKGASGRGEQTKSLSGKEKVSIIGARGPTLHHISYHFSWNSHRREELKEKRERDRLKKERENHRRYEEQLQIEQRKAEEAQALIEKMEREEMELIENLKATQKLQEDVSWSPRCASGKFVLFTHTIFVGFYRHI